MDYKGIREEINQHAEKEDVQALKSIALGLLLGRESQDKNVARLIEMSRPAVGMEQDWNAVVTGLTQ
jgi:hypothetical protein